MSEFFYSFTRMSGLIIIAISLTSLSGHISHHPALYAWTDGAGMGINTSISFVFVGISLILLSDLRQRKGRNGQTSGG